MAERRLSKTKAESESGVNESENPSDFGFAKSCHYIKHLPTGHLRTGATSPASAVSWRIKKAGSQWVIFPSYKTSRAHGRV